MKNKVLVELIVPDVDSSYDIYIPINKKIGNIINLLMRAVNELSDGEYIGNNKTFLYNKDTGEKYHVNSLVRETDIRNGTILVLI